MGQASNYRNERDPLTYSEFCKLMGTSEHNAALMAVWKCFDMNGFEVIRTREIREVGMKDVIEHCMFDVVKNVHLSRQEEMALQEGLIDFSEDLRSLK